MKKTLALAMIITALAAAGGILIQMGAEGPIPPSGVENVGYAQPPIYLNMGMHVDPISYLYQAFPDYDKARDWYDHYKLVIENLHNYLESLPENESPHMRIEIDGIWAEFLLDDNVGYGIFKDFFDDNVHNFGTHWHNDIRKRDESGEPIPHQWKVVQEPMTESEADRITADHIGLVDNLIRKMLTESGQSADNTNVRSVNSSIIAWTPQREDAYKRFHDEYGFEIYSKGYDEFITYFDMPVMNPFRIIPGSGFDEDPGNPEAMIDVGSVVFPGTIAGKGPGVHVGDHSIPAMKRRFLVVYLEWLYWNKFVPDNRVWHFAWNGEYHHYATAEADWKHGGVNYLGYAQEFISWLNQNFVGKTGPHGNTVAQWKNLKEIAGEFVEWEDGRSDKSSFEYTDVTTDWRTNPKWSSYPYKLRGLAEMLVNSHYVRAIPDYESQGAHVHEMEVAPANGYWEYENQQLYPDKLVCKNEDGDPVTTTSAYVAWSDSGEQTIDFSNYLGGTAKVYSGTTGALIYQGPATSVRVGEIPVVIEN